MPVTLVLGGARSGKSAYAQAKAEACARHRGARPVMLATGQAFDAEMKKRIARHQRDRDDRWRTVETPLDLEAAVVALRSTDIAVIDCLTLWISNLLVADHDVQQRAEALVGVVGRCPASLWLVSNEVGQGIVPDNPLARRFRDEAGRLHQSLAATVEEVVLVVAGLPLRLKPAQGEGR